MTAKINFHSTTLFSISEIFEVLYTFLSIITLVMQTFHTQQALEDCDEQILS